MGTIIALSAIALVIAYACGLYAWMAWHRRTRPMEFKDDSIAIFHKDCVWSKIWLTGGTECSDCGGLGYISKRYIHDKLADGMYGFKEINGSEVKCGRCQGSGHVGVPDGEAGE